MKKASLLLIALLLTGCANTPNDPRFRSLSNSEADSYRQQLMSAYKPKPRTEEVMLQPVNIPNACLVKVDKKDAEENKIKVYWFGACSNGYASGEGRLIQIGVNNLHQEIFTTLNEKHDPSGAITAIDFTNNRVMQGMIKVAASTENSNPMTSLLNVFKNNKKEGEEFKLEGTLVQFIPYKGSSNKSGVEVFTGEYDLNGGGQKGVVSSRTSPIVSWINKKQGYVFKVQDLSKIFPTDVPSKLIASRTTINSYDNKPGGVGAIRLMNGVLVPVVWHGGNPERVNVDPAYFKLFSNELFEAQEAADSGHRGAQVAGEIFSNYVQKNCANKKVQLPNGITKKQYYEFCSHFGTQARKVKAAEADYQKELARAKKKADKLLAENTEKFRQEQEHQAKMAVYQSNVRAAQAQVNAANRMANAAETAAFNQQMAQLANQANAFAAQQLNMVNSTRMMTPIPHINTPQIERKTNTYMIHQSTPNMVQVRQIN